VAVALLACTLVGLTPSAGMAKRFCPRAVAPSTCGDNAFDSFQAGLDACAANDVKCVRTQVRAVKIELKRCEHQECPRGELCANDQCVPR
jgi:hypothetical protein